METTIQNHTSGAKDFFLHLASQVALYTIVINLGNLLFRIINKAYPQLDGYYGYFGDSSISFPVALLIIVFPVFVLLNYFIEKSFIENPEKKNIWIRKWLIYLTLFISGIILVGDLVAVLYFFLDGQDLTVGFILKVLTVLVMSGSVFTYYLGDIREKNSVSIKKISLGISLVVIIVSIILGFLVLGSPRTQRLLKYDQAKITDLTSITSSIQYFYNNTGKLPDNLKQITENQAMANTYTNMKDKQTGDEYVYQKITDTKYKICADFNLESRSDYGYYDNYYNWTHPKGDFCFEKTVYFDNFNKNQIPIPYSQSPESI